MHYLIEVYREAIWVSATKKESILGNHGETALGSTTKKESILGNHRETDPIYSAMVRQQMAMPLCG